jgi:hypothetical protein
MSDLPIEAILARLAAAERAGRLNGLEIEFWSGGGLPPPYYRSDQLRLMTRGAQDVVEFATIKWDESFNPPQLQEKWLLPLRPEQTSEVIRLLLATKVFTTTYPEEHNPNIGDVLSHEILLTADGAHLQRKYYRQEPVALAPLRAAIAGLIQLAKTHGRHGVFHQGKEVPPPPP